MATMRGVFIGLLLWLFALFLFFVVLGGMGLFGRSVVQSSIKRSVAERMKPDSGDPFADNDLDPAEVEAQVEAQQSSHEYERWVAQGQVRNATRPTTPRGTTPRPMTDLRTF